VSYAMNGDDEQYCTRLTIDVHAHLDRVQSSRRLQRERRRNIALAWPSHSSMPDCRMIAEFRKDIGKPSARSAASSW
jgi:hypothetical protein